MDANKWQININDWASERGVFGRSTPISQLVKTMDLVDELRKHIELQRVVIRSPAKPNSKIQALEDLREVVRADIGAIMVNMTIQATMQGLTLEECMVFADMKREA